MARTNKTLNSNRSDDHMGRRRQLRIDSQDQMERHINKKVRPKKKLPPLTLVDPKLKPETIDDIGQRTIEEENDLELARDASLILALRTYELNPVGEIIGRDVSEDDFCAIHRETRRQRAHYRDLNKQMVAVGRELKRFDTSDSRKVGTRTVPGILKSIMVRLMPHEGIAFESIKNNQAVLDSAMDETVKAFELATGCEVVTAATHRMNPRDCHIHIQYTMVKAVTETTHMLGRRLTPWKKLASKMARESLALENIMNPSPAAIGARKRRLISEGKLSAEPVAGIEFRKFSGRRDLSDGAILGYSFRQKLNLVRAAQAGGEDKLAIEVTKLNDERFGRFEPIASRDDSELAAKYLDLWLEREWRKNLTSKLPEEIRNGLIADGVNAARDYATFGTTAVEITHIEDKKVKLKNLTQELELKIQENAQNNKFYRQQLENEANKKLEKMREEVSKAEASAKASELSKNDALKLAKQKQQVIDSLLENAKKVEIETAKKIAAAEKLAVKETRRQYEEEALKHKSQIETLKKELTAGEKVITAARKLVEHILQTKTLMPYMRKNAINTWNFIRDLASALGKNIDNNIE